MENIVPLKCFESIMRHPNFKSRLNYNSVTREKPSNITDEEVYGRLKTFPKTRFYGSKKRLLPWIYENIKNLEFNTSLDAFGGTASVSLLLKAMGKDVTFNDALRSNSLSAAVLLADDSPIKDSNIVYNIIDNIKPKNGFIHKTFSGMYYTEEENKWLDGAIQSIYSLKSEKERQILFYCLFQACLMKRPFNLFHRANLNLRLNKNAKRTFGNLTTWNSPFSKFMKDTLMQVQNVVWKSHNHCEVLEAQDAMDIDAKYDFVYLDPPYVDRHNKNDDYLKRYHFLEGICQYDNWPSLIDANSYNRAFISRNHINEWQKKNTFEDRLFSLVHKHRKSIVALSYLANVCPSQENLLSYFRDKFKKISISSQSLSHALAKEKKTEILIIGIP